MGSNIGQNQQTSIPMSCSPIVSDPFVKPQNREAGCVNSKMSEENRNIINLSVEPEPD